MSDGSKESTGQRLRGLDALRGLAALSVVLYHYTAGYTQITGLSLPVSFSFPRGHYGVQLFFIISGYVIFMTLERTRRASEFALSRAARLWPAYLACLIITLAVVVGATPSWYPPLSGSVILKNLTMAPEILNAYPVDRSYWSLVHEIVFYVWAGTCYFVLGRRWADLLSLLWLLMSEASWVLERRFGVQLNEQAKILAGVSWAPLFVTGVMLYRLRQESRTRLTVAVLVFALALGGLHGGWSFVPISRAGYACLILGCALLVWLATLPRSPLARLRPLVFLGDISYPLYLVHQMVGYVIIAKLVALGWNADASVLVTILLIILLAFLISKLVEKPCQRAIRRAFARTTSDKESTGVAAIPPAAIGGPPQP